MSWHGLSNIGSKQFRCGYCGFNVANNKGYFPENSKCRIYLCPNCDKPNLFDENSRQYLGVTLGNEVQALPLEEFYREARNGCSVSAFTASVLASRKMWMNIAVHQGAEEALKFMEYVEYSLKTGSSLPTAAVGRSHTDKGQ